VHARNLAWLTERTKLEVVTATEDLAGIVERAAACEESR
jgi:hypothetical protein